MDFYHFISGKKSLAKKQAEFRAELQQPLNIKRRRAQSVEDILNRLEPEAKRYERCKSSIFWRTAYYLADNRTPAWTGLASAIVINAGLVAIFGGAVAVKNCFSNTENKPVPVSKHIVSAQKDEQHQNGN